MALTQLVQVLTFTDIAASDQATLPHALNLNGTAVVPDLLLRDNGDFTIISATSTQITVENTSGAPATLNLWVERLHTLERAIGPVTNLTPQPFIPATGGGGGGSGTVGPGTIGTLSKFTGATAVGDATSFDEVAPGSGIRAFADTDVVQSYAGVRLYRGATFVDASLRAGVTVGDGSGQFADGTTPNALVLWSLDPSGNTYGIEFATGDTPNLRARITPGGRLDTYGDLHVNGRQLVVFGIETGFDTIFNHFTDDTGDVTINGGRETGIISIGRLNTGTVFIGGSGTSGEALNPVSVRANLIAGSGIPSTAEHSLHGQVTLGDTNNVGGSIFNYLGDASHDVYIRPGANGARIRIGPDTASDIFIGGVGVNTRHFGLLGFYGVAAIAQQTVAVDVAAIHAALVNLGLISVA
mgnify:CR=1 FL=1